MGRGFFIVLEGVDGVGKTTQATLLAGALAKHGRRVLLTREPTKGETGQRLREYLAGTDRHLSPLEELELFQTDRREHVEKVIRPALERGWVVISDRFYYSSAAYQGALGLDPEEILAASEAFAPRPDLLVLLTLPVNLALARRLGARSGVLQVSENPAYLEKVAALYDTFAGPHIKRLDAARAAPEVLESLLTVVLGALATATSRLKAMKGRV